jgi:hypothetical protein
MIGDTVSAVIKSEVDDLVTEHAWILDHGDPATLADLYTDDGELLGLAEPLVGRDAIRGWGVERAKLDRVSRHVHTNLRVRAGVGDRVLGSVMTLLYRQDGVDVSPTYPVLVLDYDDEYALSDGRYRFARRRITRIFLDRERLR